MARKAKVRRDGGQSGADYERRTERLKAWATLVAAFGSLGGLGGLAVYLGAISPSGPEKVTPSVVTGNSSAAVPSDPPTPGAPPPVTPPAADQGGGTETGEVESSVIAPSGRSTVKCKGSAAYCSRIVNAQLGAPLQHIAGANGSQAKPSLPEPVPVPPEPVPVPPEPIPVPPPGEPTPVPPRPCVGGPFMVFFDWDKDEITPQASAILDNAASAYQTCGQAQVMMAGHTDRSGPASYNVRLSQRRTENVRSYLAGRGIPDGVMSAEAFGESRPLVDTADGVDEPQNRRVEITFGPGSGW